MAVASLLRATAPFGVEAWEEVVVRRPFAVTGQVKGCPVRPDVTEVAGVVAVLAARLMEG